nr:TetR/AcrR family transcriptional regulator C-terminal domain-containing protein [Prauserella shujinwangii]
MVRRLPSEAARLPAGTLAPWHESGPRRAERALAHQLRRLADRGLLALEDAGRAANHYRWLVTGAAVTRAQSSVPPLDDAERDDLVRSGVRAFRHGYLPPDQR